MRSMWVGNALVGFDWARDGKWDWKAENGDTHTDFASVAVARRQGYPPVLRITVGPLAVSLVVARSGGRE